MADKEMQRRDLLYADAVAVGASGFELLQFQLWLDIRDHLNSIKMTSSIHGEEYVTSIPESDEEE